MKNKIWAIGDIHGHYKELVGLYRKLRKTGLNPKVDIVVFVGDYVDGGPDTKSVLDWCIKKSKKYPHWQFLFGNHEDLLLDALVFNQITYHDYYLWWNQGGRETVDSYKIKLPKNPTEEQKLKRALQDPKFLIPLEHFEWLEDRPIWFENDNYFFIHAGVPDIPLNEFVKKLKGDEGSSAKIRAVKQAIWIRDEFFESDYDWGKKIIFGHTVWPYKHWRGLGNNMMYGSPLVQKNKIGIDGMAHNKGKLIAVELPEEKFYYQNSLSL